MSFLLRIYNRALVRWPVAMQAVQAGVLMGAGDVLAQTAVEGRKIGDCDWRRVCQFSAVGFIVVGPSLRIWYGVLDKYVTGTGKTTALKKMAVDQLTFAPIFISVIMGSIGFSQGQSFPAIRQRIQQDYKDVLLTNYKVWPLVQLCNFYLVPLRHQVATVQIVAVFWNTYLSWKTNTSLNS